MVIGHGMGWNVVLFFLGRLAFGGMLGEEVGTFRSCSISLSGKPQNSFPKFSDFQTFLDLHKLSDFFKKFFLKLSFLNYI